MMMKYEKEPIIITAEFKDVDLEERRKQKESFTKFNNLTNIQCKRILQILFAIGIPITLFALTYWISSIHESHKQTLPTIQQQKQ